MTIKITIPNTSSDTLTFGSNNTPTAAQIAGIDSGSSNGQLAIYTTASGTSTERVRVDSSGNVGIGTSSPSYKLDVRSTFAVLDGSSNIGFYANGSAYTQIWQTLQSTNDFIIQTTASKYISFGINSAEKVRIDTSGNLLINTTSAYGGTVFKLEVNSTNYCMAVNATAGGTTDMIDFYSSGTFAGKISSNGATTAYNTSSDYRLKEDVQPMTGALAKVSALKPVTFKWILDGNEGEGFIAHELAEVCPYAVNGEKDAVDAEGNIRPQSVDTSFLVATLTAAIQELKALTDTQASTITALTARIEALEKK